MLKGQGIALNAASTLDPNQIVVLAISKGPASHRALMQVINNSKAVLQALSITAVAAHLGQTLELLGALVLLAPKSVNASPGPTSLEGKGQERLALSRLRRRLHISNRKTGLAMVVIWYSKAAQLNIGNKSVLHTCPRT